ncbi:MAG TPA: ester cyclase [Anaerolineae bacterium]
MIAEDNTAAPTSGQDAARPVTDIRGTDISVLLAPGTQRRQPLAGFDEDYVDIVDYIVRCTHKIWEEKNIGLIYTHYLHNSVVHSGDGTTYGREAMVEGTIQTIAAWPDRLLYADDVVWTGNDRDGFFTSHRYTSVGTHLGNASIVPATNRRSKRSGIALCYVRENRIIEEWVASDDIAWLQGMGLSVEETVEKLASGDLGNPRAQEVHGEIERALGQTVPPEYPADQPAGFEIEDFIRRTLHEVWNRRMLGRIREAYAPDYGYHSMGGRTLYGRGDYTLEVLNVLAAFPDAQLLIDHLYWMDDGQGRYRTSMRWSLLGTHTGPGMFGEPTGARCRFWGITQHHIRDGRFVEEWTYTNELALRKRLWLARHGHLR